jgi:hypothetical protein
MKYIVKDYIVLIDMSIAFSPVSVFDTRAETETESMHFYGFKLYFRLKPRLKTELIGHYLVSVLKPNISSVFSLAFSPKYCLRQSGFRSQRLKPDSRTDFFWFQSMHSVKIRFDI